MRTLKLKLIEKLKSKLTKTVGIKIPLNVSNNIVIMAEKCKLLGYEFDDFFTFLFMTGYILYKNFINADVFYPLDMNIYTKAIADNFSEIVKCVRERKYLIDDEIFLFLENELKKSKFSFSEFNEFLKAKICENGNKIILSKTEIESYLNEYKTALRNRKIYAFDNKR